MSESLLNNEQRSRPYWLKPMPMRNGKPSAYRRLKMKLSKQQRFGSPLWPVILLLIVMLLAGCQTQPIQPCVQPTIPTAPASSLQQPQQTYSSSVQDDLSKWEKRLTIGTQKQ